MNYFSRFVVVVSVSNGWVDLFVVGPSDCLARGCSPLQISFQRNWKQNNRSRLFNGFYTIRLTTKKLFYTKLYSDGLVSSFYFVIFIPINLPVWSRWWIEGKWYFIINICAVLAIFFRNIIDVINVIINDED